MPDLSVGTKTSFGTVIFSSEGDNMISHWDDYIFLNKRRDGRFSVKSYKWAENFRNPNRYVWTSIDSVIGISTATELIDDVSRIEQSLGVSVDWSDVVCVIEAVDANMAHLLKQKLG